MATVSYYDVIATSYSCSDPTLTISSSVTALRPITCGSVATCTDCSLTPSVCISHTSSACNLMAALPRTMVAASHSTESDQLPPAAVGAVADVLQCSSPTISSRNPVTGSSCKSTSRVCLAKINSSLLCFLCGGYLIDATTINKCLHSFCRACILRHLKWVNFCPVCKALLGGTRPHKSLRQDRTLQRVVYKVVPGLYKNERERRRKFAAVNRTSEVTHKNHHHHHHHHHQKVRRTQSVHLAGSWVYSDDENFSVCLRHQLHLNFKASAYRTSFPVTDCDGSSGNTNELIIGCRFVLCPALTSMQLIRKFIKLKLNLGEQSKVFLFCSGEILPNDYTLLDIAYIFSWMKTGPLLIDYVILNTVLAGDNARRFSDDAAAAAAAALTEDAKQNSGYTSTQTNSRVPEADECQAAASGLNTIHQVCSSGVPFNLFDQNSHLGLNYETKDLNGDRSRQDLTLTESFINFSAAPNNVPRCFLPSFSEVAPLHSLYDASRLVHLGMKDLKASQTSSAVDCLEDPPTLDYSGEVMMTATSECLRPELSTNQFAQAAYQQMSYGLANGLAILPDTALAASAVPHLDSSMCAVGGMCGVGGLCSYGGEEDASTCGIQLIGVLAESVSGSVIQIPDSCFVYNRPAAAVISGWHPTFHEVEMEDNWRNSDFIDREKSGEGLQFLLPMMHPRTKAVSSHEVADMAGIKYQYCSANAECLTNSFTQPCLPYHGRNYQTLPAKAVFNADVRAAEVTEGEMLNESDKSRQRPWLGTSQVLAASGDAKGDTGGDRTVYCGGEEHSELNRETDVPEQQCVILSEGLPQSLPLLQTDGQKESTQIFKMYDLSAGSVSETGLVIDRSVAAPISHATDSVVLQDNCSCSLSVPSGTYRTTSLESHRMTASKHHLPQTGTPLTQIISCAVMSVEKQAETLEASSHLTQSSLSSFPTTFRCSSPPALKKCQVTAASLDHSIPPPPPPAPPPASLPYVEQNSLGCNTDTIRHSYVAGSDTGWQVLPTALHTDVEDMSQLSVHVFHWDESLTSVSSELTKRTPPDAVESESERVEREPQPVDDVQLLALTPHPHPHRLSFDSTNITDHRSLEELTSSQS